MSDRPLAGRTVVVTRAKHQAGQLSRELEALGARVVELPAIEIGPPDSYEPLDAALANLRQYQWLIVTSANTVRVLRDRMASLGLPLEAFVGLQCAAVGSATATALRELGIRVDVVPKEYVAESLVATLCSQVSGARVLLARAAVARDVIPDELRRVGATIDVVDSYRTVIPQESVSQAREIFSGSAFPDAVTFTSSSTVTNFFRLLQESGIVLSQSVRTVSIGPITTATLREHGLEPVEAEVHDVPGLIAATVRLLE